MVSREQMRGHPEEGGGFNAALPVSTPTLPENPPDEPPVPEGEKKKGRHPTDVKNVEEDGDWNFVYTLQYSLEPTKDDPEGKDIERLRFRHRVYVRDMRIASRGETGLDTHVFLASRLSGTPVSIFDRMDPRDYFCIHELVLILGGTIPPL